MRPTTQQLGLPRNKLKTLLKRNGYKVRRDFFKWGACVCTKGQRHYRFRWWGEEGFVVDISALDFDRWANSVERTVPFQQWLKEQT